LSQTHISFFAIANDTISPSAFSPNPAILASVLATVSVTFYALTTSIFLSP